MVDTDWFETLNKKIKAILLQMDAQKMCPKYGRFYAVTYIEICGRSHTLPLNGLKGKRQICLGIQTRAFEGMKVLVNGYNAYIQITIKGSEINRNRRKRLSTRREDSKQDDKPVA
jgi:hypothetical protein